MKYFGFRTYSAANPNAFGKNSYAAFNRNAPWFSYSGIPTAQIAVQYGIPNSFNFNTTLVEQTPSVIQLSQVLNPTLTTTPQLLTTELGWLISGLLSFSAVTTGNVTFQLVINNTPYWWNGSSWAVSDGSFAQSNNAMTINANTQSLWFPVGQAFLQVRTFLFSPDGITNASATSFSVGYQWFQQNSQPINQCVIGAYLGDLIGDNLVLPTAKLYVSCDHAYTQSGRVVQPFSKVFYFDSNGFLQASVNETAAAGVKLQFQLVYFDGLSTKTTRFVPAIVPNQPAVSLQNLTTAVNYDFG